MDDIWVKEEDGEAATGDEGGDDPMGMSSFTADNSSFDDESKANMDRLKEELEESLNNQEERDTSWEQGSSSRPKEKKKERSKKEIEEEEREKMQVLVSNFTEDQLNHYEMFRRAAFPKAAIKRVTDFSTDSAQKKRSSAWSHFTVVRQGETAACRHCHRVVSYRGNSVSNLVRHYKTLHGPNRKVVKAAVAEGAASSVSPAASSMSDSSDPLLIATAMGSEPDPGKVSGSELVQNEDCTANVKQDIDEQLLRVLVKNYLPFSTVESAEFVKFVELLCPEYRLPSTEELDELLHVVYNSTKVVVRSSLSEATAVALTVDRWTSSESDVYIAVTAHYLDDKTTLRTAMLGCEHLPTDSADSILSAISSVIKEWEIGHKVTAVVSDNVSVMGCALARSGYRNVECFARAFNLSMLTALAKIEIVRSKASAVARRFCHSAEDAKRLWSVQRHLGQEHLTLELESPGRWNSTYDMFETLLKVKDALTTAIGLLNFTEDMTLSELDWEVMVQVVDVLEPTKEAAELAAADNSLPLSTALLMLIALQKKLAVKLEDPCLRAEVRDLLSTVIQELNDRFGTWKENGLVLSAAVLDPRVKMRLFEANAEEKQAIKQMLVQSLLAQTPVEEAAISPERPTPKKITSGLLAEFAAESRAILESCSSSTVALVEVEKYFAEPIIPFEDDPLDWWEQNQSKFPKMTGLMKEYLCVPASSVPCQLIFTEAGNLNLENRSRLESCNLNQILFLNENW